MRNNAEYLNKIDLNNFHGKNGYYGSFGGCFIPEILHKPIAELKQQFTDAKTDDTFQNDLNKYLHDYCGRPTPLYFARQLSEMLGLKIYLKREDLLHTGAHKINNAMGQCLLAKHIGKKRIICETGAGQHGVATASVCALLGLQCVVYMGALDMARQQPNVLRMRLLGAEVVAVQQGAKTLKEAVNEAMRDWSANADDTHYCLGSALGPAPFPEMVAYFHRVIGEEVLTQLGDIKPDALMACVGGGSNAIGLFQSFINDHSVRLIGVEAGGLSLAEGQHAARMQTGAVGVLHGSKTYVLQTKDGQTQQTHSISAGLDYPAISPQHACLADLGRAEYVVANDKMALNGFEVLAKTEGIIPALESSHALGYIISNAKEMQNQTVVINLSGRGDKDLSHYEQSKNKETKA